MTVVQNQGFGSVLISFYSIVIQNTGLKVLNQQLATFLLSPESFA